MSWKRNLLGCCPLAVTYEMVVCTYQAQKQFFEAVGEKKVPERALK